MKPTSDMILQKMLDAAEEYGLGWCEGAPFETAGDFSGELYRLSTTHCCAIGALALAVDPAGMKDGASAYRVAANYLEPLGLSDSALYKGNDADWCGDDVSESYAIGAAFRDAMGGEK